MKTTTCTCWCEAEEVSIPVEWIGEGRTRSCSLGCEPGCPARAYDAFELDYNESGPPELGEKERKRMTTIDYDAAADSSPATADIQAVYPGLVVVQAGACECGCGGAAGRRSKFLPGHDAKLKGKLQRAMAADAPVNLVGPDGSVMTTTAENVARNYGWLGKVAAGADRIIRRSQTPVAAERRVAAMVAERADTEEFSLVSFGRWDKTGRAMAVWTRADGTYETAYATEEGTVEVTSLKIGASA